MNTKQIEKLKEIIREKEKDADFNDYIFNYCNEEQLKNIETIEDLNDYLDTLNEDHDITNAEVIYYHSAIDYLKQNDASLMESLEIAKEYGYTIDKLNSELLASLLKTQNNEEAYYEVLENIKKECVNIFEEVKDE
jgi:vacuolar-type H+-ATPase subunit I/STV1